MFRQSGVCNNCNKPGHFVQHCKMPITSVGVILVRFKPHPEYLLIRRQHTIGFVEFLRGKYKLHNKLHLLQLIAEMSVVEKTQLLTQSFEVLWAQLWQSHKRMEDAGAREKFEALTAGVTHNNSFYNLQSLMLTQTLPVWAEPEWGFPKGRHNNNENDIYCALREFEEETGISAQEISLVQNLAPYSEIFMGSNYKCYLHKYYVALCNNAHNYNMEGFQTAEVSKMQWTTFDEAVKLFRPYNLERIKTLSVINRLLTASAFITST